MFHDLKYNGQSFLLKRIRGPLFQSLTVSEKYGDDASLRECRKYICQYKTGLTIPCSELKQGYLTRDGFSFL